MEQVVTIAPSTKWGGKFRLIEILRRFQNGKVAVRVDFNGSAKVFHVEQGDIETAQIEWRHNVETGEWNSACGRFRIWRDGRRRYGEAWILADQTHGHEYSGAGLDGLQTLASEIRDAAT